MKPFLYPFIILSAVGLGLSIVVHIAALFGLATPLGEQAWILHMGIFTVWLPAMLVIYPLTKEFKQKDLWKAALRGCPDWMKWMTYGFFGSSRDRLRKKSDLNAKGLGLKLATARFSTNAGLSVIIQIRVRFQAVTRIRKFATGLLR
jgi:hypothetical protein